MYSSHDTQVGLIWNYLNPTNFDPYYIPYASFIQMEFYKDQNCKDFSNTVEECYAVQFLMNGHKLEFDIPNFKNQSMISYSAMKKYLEKISYLEKGFDAR